MHYIAARTENTIISLDNDKFIKFATLIAKAYILLLPIRMISPLFFIKQYVGVCARNFDLILHVLGLLLIFVRSRGIIHVSQDKVSKLYRFFAWMIVWFNFSSFIMAFVIQNKYGNIGSESAFKGILGMLVYFTQYAFIVFYNKEIFKFITKEEIVRILKIVINFLLVLGYFQIVVINYGGVFASIYDNANILYIYNYSNMSKLSLTGSEGASAGTIIGTFVYPFIMSRIFVENKKIKLYLLLLAWLPIIYFTDSSTAYILIAIDLFVFSILCILKTNNVIKRILIFSIITLSILFGLAFQTAITKLLPYEIRTKIEYLLFEKVTDESNGSTVSRTIPLLVNWGAFSEFPFIGVGNGNQGYFFEKYYPSYAYENEGSDASVFLEKSKNEISNGGVFFPSLLSGYGIIGVIIVLIYTIKCSRCISGDKDSLGSFYYMFYISWIAIFFAGFQGDFTGNYLIWFLLSIPYMVRSQNHTLGLGNQKTT